MIFSAKHMLEIPVVSLTGSGRIATIKSLLVDKTTGRVELIRVQNGRTTLYLPFTHVRDFSTEQVIVDSETSLTDEEDLVRHQALIQETCELFGYRVVTQSGNKLGTCYDYIFDITSHLVVKIYVNATLVRRFLTPHFSVDQADIITISKKAIVVRDSVATELKRVRVKQKQPLPVQHS